MRKILKQINFVLVIVIISTVLLSSVNTFDMLVAIVTFGVVTNLFLINQPVLFFTLSFHTLQASILAFYAEFENLHINDFGIYGYNQNLSLALQLSCLGIIVISCCIYYFIPKRLVRSSQTTFNSRKLIITYVILFLIGLFANQLGQFGGLFQLLYKISTLKWAVLFLIMYSSLREKKLYFLIIIFLEIFIGLFSFFSNFKDTLVVSFYAFLILGFNFFKIQKKYFLIFGSLCFALVVLWQGIKEDYRSFLSGGEQSQTIVVDFSDAYSKIIDLATETPKKSEKVIDKTIERISYIDYFAEAINYIPNHKQHTNGSLWGGAILHILQPRLFFPNKKSIDDSEKTMEYTGMSLTGAEQGTSISLGYIAESYVDFGRYLFLMPLAVLGFLIGWLFKKLYQSGIPEIYYWAFTIPFYFQFYGLEMASEKIIGSLVMYVLVVLGTVHFLGKKFSWLEN